MKKVLLLTNTIAPYRIPVLNKFNEDVEYDLTVWYLEEKEKNRKWNINHKEIKYKYECLNGVHAYIQSMDMGVHFNPGLLLKLIRFKPEVIITSGYDAIAYWTALFYSKVFKKKYIVWWGSTLQSSRVKNKLVNSIRRYFFSKTDQFLTYGNDATECLLYYGVPKSSIVTGYNTVDVRHFYKNNKVRHNLPTGNEDLKFIYIGQLISRKGLNEILNALEQVNRKDWSLTIVGSGPEQDKLKAKVENTTLSKKITFLGYKQKEEIIELLAKSDCLIFPSLIEVWGLVVNEAIATNTFVLSSIYAGSTRDIIIDNVNGLKVDPLSISDMVNSIEWVLDNKQNINKKKLPLSLWKKIHPFSYALSLKRAVKKVIV